MDEAPVVLDGSLGEGGGQILRTALFLSILLGRPFRIDRIRAGRRDAGLKPQHVAIIRILEQVTESTAQGVTPGSPSVEFRPSEPHTGSYTYDVGTAGSLPLVLQTMIPAAFLCHGSFSLRLTGGTDVTWGPTADWVGNVLLPRLRPLARELDLHIERRGFYPKGGGVLELVARDGPGRDELARRVRAVLGVDRSLQGRIERIEGSSVAHVSLQGARVAERQAEAAATALRERGLPEPHVRTEYAQSPSTGSSLTLWARDAAGNLVGADGLGAQGRRAEEVGAGVAQRLWDDWSAGATVDRHLADHIVPWIALGAGAVRVPHATDHLSTNVAVCQAFLGPDAVRLDGLILRHG